MEEEEEGIEGKKKKEKYFNIVHPTVCRAKPEFKCVYVLFCQLGSRRAFFVNRARVASSMHLIRCTLRGFMLVIGYEELSPGAHI